MTNMEIKFLQSLTDIISSFNYSLSNYVIHSYACYNKTVIFFFDDCLIIYKFLYQNETQDFLVEKSKTIFEDNVNDSKLFSVIRKLINEETTNNETIEIGEFIV